MDAQQPAAPGRGKRALFAGVLVVALALVTEAASFLLLWFAEGARPGPARFRQARAEAAAAGEGPTGPLLAPVPGRRRVAWSDQVVHPFLGYVQNPDKSPDRQRRVTGLGFLATKQRPPVPPGERFTIGIFGGSVAQIFAFLGQETLIRELAAAPAVGGRPIWVESYSLGGYKQPQQLMALAYLLALGHEPDLVIVLDGFNDVVLPVAENLRLGVNPFYPRGWPDRVQQVPDAEVMRRVGEIAYLRGERQARSGLCDSAPLAWSSTCHLLWRALDRRLAGRIAALEEEVATMPRRSRSFLITGPAHEAGKPEEIYRELAEYWGRCSRLMADLCRARGIPYFHFLQPNQYVAGSKPMTAAERQVATSEQELYRPHAEQGYPYLLAEGRRLVADGVPFHDLTRIFAEVEQPLYIDTCCHFNQRGNELLAAHVGRLIAGELAASTPAAAAAGR